MEREWGGRERERERERGGRERKREKEKEREHCLLPSILVLDWWRFVCIDAVKQWSEDPPGLCQLITEVNDNKRNLNRKHSDIVYIHNIRSRFTPDNIRVQKRGFF